MMAVTLYLSQSRLMGIFGGADHAPYMYGSESKDIRADIGSRTWITPKKTALIIKKLIDDLPVSSSPKRLLNMTANCGGDLLPFVDDESYVGRAYELSPEIYNILVKNVETIAGDRKDSWELINSSSTDDDGEYDFIIVDPPFGDEYKMGKVYQPHLGDINMSQLVNRFAGRTKYILLKLPMVGFDIDGFVKDIPDSMTMKIYTPDVLKKFDGKTHKILLILLSKKY